MLNRISLTALALLIAGCATKATVATPLEPVEAAVEVEAAPAEEAATEEAATE